MGPQEARKVGLATGQQDSKALPGERYFVWVDLVGKRCGPRHGSMKAAINYYRVRKHPRKGWENEHKGKHPSDAMPLKLIVAELVEREMTEQEKEDYKLWEQMVERGLA